jgi:hypothetical protein
MTGGATKTLFDFNAEWKEPEKISDDELSKIKAISFDSEYFYNWCYVNDDMFLSKTRINLSADKRLVGKGKNSKFKYFLLFSQYWKALDDVIFDEIECKTLDELINWYEHYKDNCEVAKELILKGIIFDGRRYWWKFNLGEDERVEFTRKASLEEVEGESEETKMPEM